MLKKFSSYFFSSSDENRLLVVVLLILSGVSSLIALYNFLFYQTIIYPIATTVALAALSSVILLYFSKVTFDAISRLIVALLLLLVLGGFIFTHNTVTATIFLVIFPVVLIALRPDSEWAISIFIFIMVMIFVQIFGLTAIDLSWKELTLAWMMLTMISIFLGYYVLMSRETKKRLAVEQNKLATMNSELEKQVAIRTKELQEANEKLTLDITLDPVTGIMNKRTFIEKLRHEIKHFKLDNTCFSIIVFDIDNFYQINHGYGRRIGDEILTKIAALTIKNSLSVDIVARVAGDEFAILMHDVTRDKAVERAERIREHLEWAVFLDNYQVTASFGVVEFHDKSKEIDEHIVMHQADIALQKAKHRGKNRVC